MAYFYATFPWKSSLRNAYIRLNAEDAVAAQEKMNQCYGDKWAFIYDESEFAGQVERYSLYEVELGTKNFDWPPEERMNDTMKHWVDDASYQDLLTKLRFEPVGSPWFSGECGEYLMAKLREKKAKLSEAEQARISKVVGWEKK